MRTHEPCSSTTTRRDPRVAPLVLRCGLLVLLAGAVACGSSLEPASGVTVLVTNTTCTPGPCARVRILAFPSNQPNTPGGFWSLDLGVITTASACVTLPLTASFYIISEAGDDTTNTFTWTTARSVSLGGQPESASRLMAGPTTDAFVPISAGGWRIDLPGGTHAVPAAACTP